MTTPQPALLQLVGGTPVVPIATESSWYTAKLEAASIAGMKARAALSMLRGATARGELAPGATIIESTSGTLGLGLALAGKALGHPVLLVVDDELEPELRSLFSAFGITLQVVATPHPTGGWQRARLDRLAELLAATPGAYWPDQYDNPDNAGGYQAMGAEILDQVDTVDVLVASIGSGGHCAGLTRVLRTRWPHLRVIGVDAVGSRIFGQPDRRRLMRGLGSSILPRNVAYADFDEVHWVGASEAVASCRRLAASTGIAGGWSTGAAALVAGWAADRAPEARVLTVFPDGPHRYLRTIYDDDWCHANNLLGPHAHAPAELESPTGSEVTGWGRCAIVRDPAAEVTA
ncbi:pyridoxal-5'-phosphate-dependent protein subunit beta [Nocardia sp. MH4]|uniref:PLP-dependent cysteine synthase family protein n=1 Tax=unclassified Nocardia TaxID=2637762 RepID=UPI001C4E7852|nr:pyridoxal-phosphate dependent enzyme [Nocardia sp. MH4]MBW0270279.1 pyridoxal-5'-phosphate-dependent protein subunit beta [Nocardia sp. MH4]